MVYRSDGLYKVTGELKYHFKPDQIYYRTKDIIQPGAAPHFPVKLGGMKKFDSTIELCLKQQFWTILNLYWFCK